MDLGLKDQVAIVTGGSRGIGRATAEALLREGAKVVVTSVRPASVEAAIKELSALGTVEGIAADVSVETDVVRLVAETVDLFGGLDVMVANAGIGGDSVNLADMTAEQWDEMMGVHMRGSFFCGREAARAMRSGGRRGRIVTVGLGAMDRIGNPEEIASAILFLASERCGFLTGETFVVDGGQLIIASDPAPAAPTT
jgi:NAD(P)-dependent dehydrogenase (short-subunit alcohol dehydrogenase family)